MIVRPSMYSLSHILMQAPNSSTSKQRRSASASSPSGTRASSSTAERAIQSAKSRDKLP